jgi:dihydroxy-acid dehydratase
MITARVSPLDSAGVTTTTPDLKPRSRDVTDGLERAAARGMLRAVGMGDEDFAKPQIGVASSWNEITPCNLSLQRLARPQGRRARRRRLPAGVRHDLGVRRHRDGHEGMHFSLVSAR